MIKWFLNLFKKKVTDEEIFSKLVLQYHEECKKLDKHREVLKIELQEEPKQTLTLDFDVQMYPNHYVVVTYYPNENYNSAKKLFVLERYDRNNARLVFKVEGYRHLLPLLNVFIEKKMAELIKQSESETLELIAKVKASL